MRSNRSIDQAALKEELFNSFLELPPRDDDELHLWLQVFTGFNIPRRVSGICPSTHVPPFGFIADQFFERITSCFGFGNRSSGKTRMTALLNLCDLIFKPGIEIVTAGAVKDQAIRGYEYLIEFFQKEPLLQRLLAAQPTMSRTVLTNGSRIIITTCTYAGLNGPHPNKLRIDEIELVHPNYLAEGLSMTQAHPDGWKAQDTFTSTRKVASGTVQKLLDEAEQRRVAVKAFCIWENLEKCTRKCRNDPKHGNCSAYSKRDKDGKEVGICGILDGAAEPHGKAQKLPIGGWYKLDDFIKKVAILDRQTWNAQWLNEKPSGGALVYGEFYNDEPPYVVEPEEAGRLLERARREKNWPRVIGIDFGSRFAVEYLMQDPLEAPWGWYVYHEIYWTEDNDLPLVQRCQEIRAKDPLGWNNRTMVYADPSGKQLITDMNSPQIGIDCTGANNDVMAGLNHVKTLFERRNAVGMPGLRIFSHCKELRKELAETYVHPQDKDGEINRDKILKKNDHAADALRYAALTFSTVGTSQYTPRRIAGMW